MSFRCSIAGDVAEIAAAQSALAAWMTASGASPRSITRAEIALEELALNALRHGGAPALEVEAGISEGICTLVLEDAGTPFDPSTAALPAHAASLDGDRVGGLGLALVRRNASALRYRRTEQGRNHLEVDLPIT